jgi:hypothetical protein
MQMKTFQVTMPSAFRIGDTHNAGWPPAPDAMDQVRFVTWRDTDTLVTDRGESARIIAVEDLGIQKQFTCAIDPERSP